MKSNFSNFPPIFKNTLVSREENGHLMKDYAVKEGIMSQPRRVLISSFFLANGNLTAPLLLLYLNLGLVCKKTNRLVHYNPKKCFKSFVQSAVNAKRQGDENPKSSVVAETMKPLANNSYGYQKWIAHTVTKYLND